ncbi:hypothetical protein DFH07DRAFT_952416 [Mycena maculata]|uniref:Uncharacterized protein n=1 Tax=Mycena maculata TaxID=230809 RepID=A0AAD7JXT5_9AGAR|nr:hypothetical protein DFH07DRAFT_952416 [Mycena maculata]
MFARLLREQEGQGVEDDAAEQLLLRATFLRLHRSLPPPHFLHPLPRVHLVLRSHHPHPSSLFDVCVGCTQHMDVCAEICARRRVLDVLSTGYAATWEGRMLCGRAQRLGAILADERSGRGGNESLILHGHHPPPRTSAAGRAIRLRRARVWISAQVVMSSTPAPSETTPPSVRGSSPSSSKERQRERIGNTRDAGGAGLSGAHLFPPLVPSLRCRMGSRNVFEAQSPPARGAAGAGDESLILHGQNPPPSSACKHETRMTVATAGRRAQISADICARRRVLDALSTGVRLPPADSGESTAARARIFILEQKRPEKGAHQNAGTRQGWSPSPLSFSARCARVGGARLSRPSLSPRAPSSPPALGTIPIPIHSGRRMSTRDVEVRSPPARVFPTLVYSGYRVGARNV